MTMRIYVGTYAKYNDGNLFGKWLDLEDYADRDDYRCGSDAGVTLFIKKINDEAARTYVESSCDEVRKVATGGKCRLTVRLKYSEDDLGEDVQSYGLRRITIDVSEATVLLPRRR